MGSEPRPLRAPPRPYPAAAAPVVASAAPVAAPRSRETGLTRVLGLLMVAYLFHNGFASDVVFETADDAYSASPVERIIKLGALAGGLLMFAWRPQVARPLMSMLNGPMRAFFALALLSAAWSIDRGATIARCITLFSMAGAALLYVLGGWHPRRFQQAVLPAVTLLVVGALLVGFFDHDIVVEHGDGTLKDSWRGLSGQKNQFGQVAGFAAIIWLNGWLAGERRLVTAAIGFAVSIACVFLSRSSTSILATLLALTLMVPMLYAPPGLRRYLPYMAGTFAVIVIVYAVAVLQVVPGLEFLLNPIANLTGKDLTFSNRSEIWGIVKENIALHPYLGSGYGAYWVGPFATSPSYQFVARMYFYPSESHNGYLEIVNDLGLPGLACVLGFFVVYMRQALRLMRFDRGQGVLYIALFFFQAIVNLSQSCWFATNAAITLSIMTLAVICMGRALLEVRAPQWPPAPVRRW